MRENRTCGSEGGEAQSLPYPYPGNRAHFQLSTIHYQLSTLTLFAGCVSLVVGRLASMILPKFWTTN